MLISLHVPKTAGSSFRELLALHYGERLRADYADRPLHQSVPARRAQALRAGLGLLLNPSQLQGVDAVHGHFLAIKYSLWRGGPGWHRVTWLRDPVERLASHYYYWRRSYDPGSAGSLHRRVVEEDWTLERFCLGPELRNSYRQFLWGVPLARFTFVGITEHYTTEVADFSRLIPAFAGSPLPQQEEVVNANPAAGERYINDASLRQRIERYHADDVALYREALRRRQLRLSAATPERHGDP